MLSLGSSPEAKLFFRSFDPQETPRLSAPSAFEQVAQSFGVLVHLLPERIADSPIHNMQSAFLAGLADGFEKVLLILQDGEASVITSKAANDYHFKTGQCEVAGTFMFYLVIPCRGKFNL